MKFLNIEENIDGNIPQPYLKHIQFCQASGFIRRKRAPVIGGEITFVTMGFFVKISIKYLYEIKTVIKIQARI